MLWWLSATASAEPLAVTTRQIDTFSSGETDGRLEFLGGIEVRARDSRFGGLSGIDVLGDGSVLMVGDTGIFVRARLVHENGRLVGLDDVEIDPLFPAGEVSKVAGDAEDIALDPSDPSRGVIVRERQANALLSFELEQGLPTNFEPRLVGADDSILKSNKGLESVAYAPEASPLAGEIVAIAEDAPKGIEDIPGWIAGKGQFTIVQHDDFSVSSARFLPDGDLLLLERRFQPLFGLAMRLRRIDGSAIAVGARLDGDILLDAGMASEIDNMEGLAVQREESGRIVLTLVSDDNQNILQRTLILQFALIED
ncbi:MAG: esterase-like activity of phytase family protein [Propylenella sp.]